MNLLPSQKNDFLLCRDAKGTVKVEVMIKNESIWLSINQMAELFGINKSGISRHIKNVFETGELERASTVANFATVQIEGNYAL